MIVDGVPAGATTPSQNGDNRLGKPASGAVGTSGNFGLRCAPAIASARNAPDWMCGRTVVIGSMTTWTSPATTATSMGAVPRYGTCRILASVSSLNNSTSKCGAVPNPCEPQLTLPGLALAYFTRSVTVFTGRSWLTAKICGVSITSQTGANTLTGS